MSAAAPETNVAELAARALACARVPKTAGPSPPHRARALVSAAARRSRGATSICGHNSYWHWGPGDGDGRLTIVVGGRAARIAPFFESFERIATFECVHCRPDENHQPIYIGRNLKTSYAALWPDGRHYD